MVDYRNKRKNTKTQGLILDILNRNGPQSTRELKDSIRCDDETILINCKKLVKQGWICDKENKHGKYRLEEESKVPAFLKIQTRNIMFSKRILDYMFKLNSQKENGLKYLANGIGSYILYILIESLNKEGPWTAKYLNSKDPRRYDKNKGKILINETWLRDLKENWLKDTIDTNYILDLFVDNYGKIYEYEKLLDMYEFSCPDIYNKIRFHKGVAEERSLRKKQNSNKKMNNEPEKEELIEDYDSEGYSKYLDKKGNKI